MSYKIRIYIDNGGDFGHMYVGLIDTNNIELQYGYYPTENIPWPHYYGSGVVKNNESSRRNAETVKSKEFNITEDKYNAAKAEAEKIQNNPSQYSGLGERDARNCVSIVNQIACIGKKIYYCAFYVAALI